MNGNTEARIFNCIYFIRTQDSSKEFQSQSLMYGRNLKKNFFSDGQTEQPPCPLSFGCATTSAYDPYCSCVILKHRYSILRLTSKVVQC